MGTKTKTVVISEPCKLLYPKYVRQLNPATGRMQWYCYVEVYLLGNYVSQTHTINGYDGRKRPIMFHPCTHSVINHGSSYKGQPSGPHPLEGWLPEGTGYPSTGQPGPYVENTGKLLFAQWAQYNWQSSAPEPAVTVVKLAASDAYQGCRPSFSGKFSLTNFLLELKDFGRLFKVTDEKWGLKTHVENNFLNWTFGWVPFATDLVELHKSYKRLERVWDHVIRNSGKDTIVTTRSNRNISLSSTSPQGPHQTNTWGCTINLEIILHYSYDVLDTETGQTSDIPNRLYAASVAQSLGLCANPAILWEALPFSFVIDWFVPIQKCLDDMKRDTFVPGHTIWSGERHETKVKSLSVSGTDNQYVPVPNGIPQRSPYTVSFSNRYYSRSGISSLDDYSPNPLDRLSIHGPSVKQMFVGAVLGSSIFL